MAFCPHNNGSYSRRGGFIRSIGIIRVIVICNRNTLYTACWAISTNSNRFYITTFNISTDSYTIMPILWCRISTHCNITRSQCFSFMTNCSSFLTIEFIDFTWFCIFTNSNGLTSDCFCIMTNWGGVVYYKCIRSSTGTSISTHSNVVWTFYILTGSFTNRGITSTPF